VRTEMCWLIYGQCYVLIVVYVCVCILSVCVIFSFFVFVLITKIEKVDYTGVFILFSVVNFFN